LLGVARSRSSRFSRWGAGEVESNFYKQFSIIDNCLVHLSESSFLVCFIFEFDEAKALASSK